MAKDTLQGTDPTSPIETITVDPAVVEPVTELEKSPGALGGAQVQATVDAAEDKGFFGEKADPLPNSHYSQEGGMPGHKD